MAAMAEIELVVTLIVDEDGGFVATCPALPGCISQGDTREEALANVREAITVALANREAEGGWSPARVEVATVRVPVSG
jgi:predicted RNase H-like HicB family nuclease